MNWALEELQDTTALSEQLQANSSNGSIVVVGLNDRLAGIIRLSDELRAESLKMVRSLNVLGVNRTEILSGDNAFYVQSVQEQLGITAAQGELLPRQKVEVIMQLRQQMSVAMVGDGINDAPSLARADVGIAMGAMGLDVVLKSADISLMNNDLRKLPWLVQFAREVKGTVRFNIALAIGAKLLVLVLALSGYAYLWLAVLADTGATMLVVLNALRLLTSYPK